MFYAAIIVLVVYSVAVLSLVWTIVRTASLVGRGGGIPTVSGPPSPAPSLDIVIPVKDEENVIGACLEAVLGQGYSNAGIFVVNDRSRDGTVGVVQAIQDRNPQVERLDVAHLPDGLYGKPHALSKLSPRLNRDIVFFIDSDIRIKPHCLTTVAAHIEKHRLDWLAAMGRPDLKLFWERLLVPIFGAMAYSWYDPRKISDPNRPEAIGSNFMVARREAYRALGGHAAVADQYDEDSALVRLAKRMGQRVEFVISSNLFSVSMYGDLKKTIRGFNRTLIGGLKTLPRFLITLHALAFLSILPLLLIALGVRWPDSAVLSPSMRAWLLGASGLHLVLANVLACLVYGASGVPLRFALLHPLGAIVASWVCIRAAWDLIRRRPITWRGTSYRAIGPAASTVDRAEPSRQDAAA